MSAAKSAPKTAKKTKAKTPAKRGRGRPQRFTIDQVREALKVGMGLKSVAAAKLRKSTGLPCDPKTVANMIKKYPVLNETLIEVQELNKDIAEGSLFNLLRSGDAPTVRWYLAKMASDRGYAEVVKVEGKMDHTGKVEHDHRHTIEERAKQLEGMLSDDAIELLEADLSAKVN